MSTSGRMGSSCRCTHLPGQSTGDIQADLDKCIRQVGKLAGHCGEIEQREQVAGANAQQLLALEAPQSVNLVWNGG